MSLSNQSSFTVEKAVFNLSTALRKKMSSFYPIFYTHTCTHTHARTHRVGGIGKVGERKRTLRIKEKMIKTRGEKVGKQACRIQKYRGR